MITKQKTLGKPLSDNDKNVRIWTLQISVKFKSNSPDHHDQLNLKTLISFLIEVIIGKSIGLSKLQIFYWRRRVNVYMSQSYWLHPSETEDYN